MLCSKKPGKALLMFSKQVLHSQPIVSQEQLPVLISQSGELIEAIYKKVLRAVCSMQMCNCYMQESASQILSSGALDRQICLLYSDRLLASKYKLALHSESDPMGEWKNVASRAKVVKEKDAL